LLLEREDNARLHPRAERSEARRVQAVAVLTFKKIINVPFNALQANIRYTMLRYCIKLFENAIRNYIKISGLLD
jgi:hypothetical protein